MSCIPAPAPVPSPASDGMALSPTEFIERYKPESGSFARTSTYRQAYVPRRGTNTSEEDDSEWFDDPAAALACVGVKIVAVHRYTTHTEIGDHPCLAFYDVSACRLFEGEPSQYKALGLESLYLSDEDPDLYHRILRAKVLFLDTAPLEICGSTLDESEDVGGLTPQIVRNMEAVLTRLQVDDASPYSQNIWAKALAYCGFLSRYILNDVDAATEQVTFLNALYGMGSRVFPDAVFLAYTYGVFSTRLFMHDFLLSAPGQLPLLDFHIPYILGSASCSEVADMHLTLSRPYFTTRHEYGFAFEAVAKAMEGLQTPKRQRVSF